MLLSKLPLFVFVGVLGFWAVCPACSDGSGGTPDFVVADTEYTVIELDVKGMTCGGCALATRSAVSRLEGVHSVEARYEGGDSGRARVLFDPDIVHPDRIMTAILELGYIPRVTSRSNEKAGA